mmetsp:Transcript_29381/g.32654  ORF Transcript_29381/g.32654 Transcript_29381/m.32654 type:complete len:333 (-) Transcript_29381:465-1463(-)
MLEVLTCMALGARLGGFKTHADHFIVMSKKILRNLYDTQSVSTASGAYLLGMYIATFESVPKGYFYIEMAKLIIQQLKHRRILEGDDTKKLTLIDRGFRLHHFDTNISRGEMIDNNESVVNELAALSLNNKKRVFISPEIVQGLWASITAVWFRVSRVPWFASIWGENANMPSLTVPEYNHCIKEIQRVKTIIENDLTRISPINATYFSVMVESVETLANLAADNHELALRGAWTCWHSYVNASSMSFFPGSLCTTFNCCSVAIQCKDAQLFQTTFSTLLSLSSTWRLGRIFISAVYDDAKESGLDVSAYTEIIAELRATQPTTVQDMCAYC